MNKNLITFLRYVGSAILFIILMINIYLISPGQNKFAEPWDFIISIVTPIVLVGLCTLALPLKNKSGATNYRYLLWVFLMALTMFGSQYLNRNYWYKLSGLWSFVLSVLLPPIILFVLVTLIYKEGKSENESKRKA